jgi:deazaflavin-dependent oxidoreductase (nitroreductase family)
MATRTSVTDFGFKALNAFHKSVLKISRGRIGTSAFGMPVIELRTTGRTSGATRSTMLTVPVVDGDRLVLVASKGGNDRDPDWFLNLVAHPEVEVTINSECRQLRARAATVDEKTELWPRVVATYKSYASYQRHTKRDIPLVICEPR